MAPRKKDEVEVVVDTQDLMKRQCAGLQLKANTKVGPANDSASYYCNNAPGQPYGNYPTAVCKDMLMCKTANDRKGIFVGKSNFSNSGCFSVLKVGLKSPGSQDLKELMKAAIVKADKHYSNASITAQKTHKFESGAEVFQGCVYLRTPERFVECSVKGGNDNGDTFEHYSSPSRTWAPWLYGEEEETFFTDISIDEGARLVLQDANGKTVGDQKLSAEGRVFYTRGGMSFNDGNGIEGVLDSKWFKGKVWRANAVVRLARMVMHTGMVSNLQGDQDLKILYPEFKFRVTGDIVLREDASVTDYQTIEDKAAQMFSNILYLGTQGPPRKRKKKKVADEGMAKKRSKEATSDTDAVAEVEEAIREGMQSDAEDEKA